MTTFVARNPATPLQHPSFPPRRHCCLNRKRKRKKMAAFKMADQKPEITGDLRTHRHFRWVPVISVDRHPSTRGIFENGQEMRLLGTWFNEYLGMVHCRNTWRSDKPCSKFSKHIFNGKVLTKRIPLFIMLTPLPEFPWQEPTRQDVHGR